MESSAGGTDPWRDKERSRVVHVSDCDLILQPGAWQYAIDNAAKIDQYWHQMCQANPAFFNGPVLLLSKWSMSPQKVFQATFLRAEFKAYLYWRSTGFEHAGVFDAFGSALLRSADGGLLLGEQSQGNVNAGFSYPPGGFIDDDDVHGDGTSEKTIDIGSSIRREIFEETGVDPAALSPQPGFWLTFSGAQISIAIVFETGHKAEELRRVVRQSLVKQTCAELADVHIVSSMDELSALRVPNFTHSLLAALLR